MAERLNAPVLKTGMGQPIQGSNPCLSAMKNRKSPRKRAFYVLRDRDEKFIQRSLSAPVIGEVGNPCLSAIWFIKTARKGGFLTSNSNKKYVNEYLVHIPEYLHILDKIMMQDV